MCHIQSPKIVKKQEDTKKIIIGSGIPLSPAQRRASSSFVSAGSGAVTPPIARKQTSIDNLRTNATLRQGIHNA